MKKYCVLVIVCILMLVFIFVPFPGAGLTIRVYMEEFEGENILMYYTTDEQPQMGGNQTCCGEIDRKNHVVVFRFAPELAGQINNLRLDFPEVEQMVKIRDISVSSGGVIKKHYDPCEFLAEKNVAMKNGIATINLLESKKEAYVWTEEDDPFIWFDEELLADILRQRSDYRLTRVFMCVLVIVGYGFYRFPIFGGEQEAAAVKNSRCKDEIMI